MGRVFVNPTYLWPGILGGLIMGVGFVVGGFCPGTSLVAAATLKIDGILFVVGALTGVWLFGESVSSFDTFWLSSYMGRFTLPDWLGLSVGTTVLLVVLMALAMFWAAEKIEARFAPAAAQAVPVPRRRRVLRLAGAGALVVAALVVAVRGQPTPDERWARSPKLQELVRDRAHLRRPGRGGRPPPGPQPEGGRPGSARPSTTSTSSTSAAPAGWSPPRWSRRRS